MAIEYASQRGRDLATSHRGLPRAFEDHLRRTGQTLEQWEARQSPEDVTGEALRLRARCLRLKHR
jgi:hypothetical protein